MSSVNNYLSNISGQEINSDLYNKILNYYQKDASKAEKSVKKVMECCKRIIEESKKNDGKAVIVTTDSPPFCGFETFAAKWVKDQLNCQLKTGYEIKFSDPEYARIGPGLGSVTCMVCRLSIKPQEQK